MENVNVEEFIQKNLGEDKKNRILAELVKTKDNTIYTLLEEISSNERLTQKDKNQIYFKIMNFTEEVNENLKNGIYNIYLQSANEAIEAIQQRKVYTDRVLEIYEKSNSNDLKKYQKKKVELLNLILEALKSKLDNENYNKIYKYIDEYSETTNILWNLWNEKMYLSAIKDTNKTRGIDNE